MSVFTPMGQTGLSPVCVYALPACAMRGPSFLIRAHLSGPASLSIYREAILSGQLPLKTAAFCTPRGMYGTVLCEIIHLIIGLKGPQAAIGQHKVTFSSVHSSNGFNYVHLCRQEHTNFSHLRKGLLPNELMRKILLSGVPLELLG